MKKLIAWFLVLAMCVSMFAACGQEATPTTLPTEGPTQATEAPEAVDLGDPEALASVLEYLTTIYKNAGGLTPKDFTRIGTIPFGTTKYEVVWTASVGSDLVNIIKNDDGMVTIDVNELCDTETPYTLTATITDAAGNSVSHSWEHILPAAMNVADILDEAYALESGASLPYEVTLTGVVVSVDDLWSEQYGNITVTIAMEGHEDRPVKCYRLAGDGAKELAVGDTITVTGTITNYKGIIEFAQGCTLDSRISGGGVSPSNREYKYINPLNDGDRVVIYNIAYMKALSCEKTGYYNVGVNVSRDAEGNLTGYTHTEVWTVRKHGLSYSFIDANGEKLALGDQYTSLNSDGSNDDWIFVRRNSTRYALQNAGRTELFLQWASTYNNFSTRSVIDPETNKEYVIGIYILPEDEVVEDTTVYFDATPVENPEAGTAYKLVLFQNNLGKELGFTGKMAGYYYGTSENLNEVVDVYLEAADGGYKIYFMDGNTKTYLNIVPRDNDPTKVNVVLETTGKSVYTLNTEHQYISTVVNGTEYYLGTYGTYNTISASSVSYIEDTSKIGVSQFPAWFSTTVKTDAPVEPEEPEATEPTEPSTPTEPEGGETPSEDVVEIVDAPEAGTAYKLLMDQKTNGEVLYFNGATESASVTYRLASSDDAADAVDVYLEAVSGGYRLYFMDGETKTYIRIYERTDGEAGKGKGSLELTTTAPAEVLVMDETYNTLVYVADADNSYYMGTYSTYETFSVSNYSYLSADNVDVSQFPARFALVTLADRDEPTEPEVTLSSIAVTTAPTKTEYTVGDTFDPAGLVVTATYSDGTTAAVTDYTLSAPDMTTAGTKTVTVNYEGKEATFEITVAEKEVVKTPGYQKVTSADELTTGKYVLVTDKGYAPKVLDGTWISAGKPTVNSDGTITVSNAEGYVWDLTVSGSSVTLTDSNGTTVKPKAGNNNGIQSGDYDWAWSFANGTFEFAGTGSDTTRLASNHSSSYKFRAYKNSTLTGTNGSGYSYKFTLYKLVDDIGGSGSTTEATVTSIAVTTAPTKTEYTVGDTFDPAGLVVTATYSDGTTAPVTDYTLSAPDMTTAGPKTVTVTYEGKEATFEITVAEEEPVLKDGDQVVIWAPAYNMALTSEKTGNYLAGVAVTETDGVLTGFGETAIWTVIANSDGSYSFANGGKNIGMQASYTSMSMGSVNDDWSVIALGDDLYNIKNTVRGTYMEWYAKYNNWSTYNASNAATDGQFQLAFYVIPDESEEPADPTTVTVSIADYAAANSWVSGTGYATINMDDVVTVTATGTPTGSYGLNTGKYYTNGNNWRIYQNETPSVVISAEGKTIVSVKITYTISNTGVLTLNGANIASDTVVEVNASSVTFGVGNTGTASNGQVRITAIEVVYG